MKTRATARRALPLFLACILMLVAAVSALAKDESASAQSQELPKNKLTMSSIVSTNLVTDTARLPLYRATVNGMPVWYVITEVSNQALARQVGVNFSPKLANLITPNCPCVQTVRSGRVLGRTVVRRPGAPDFSPMRLLVPGPDGGFPPAAAAVGAVGKPGYSPFVRIAGTNIVYNAPIVATGSGPFDVIDHRNTHDRLFAIDARRRTVDMGFVRAFAFGKEILYLSFEASSAAVGVLDRTTFVPALGLTPTADKSRDPKSSRSAIFVMTNGRTGRTSPPAQGSDHVIKDGLNALTFNRRNTRLLRALRAGGDAHNVLDSFPTVNPALYSPIWDVNMAEWTPRAVARGQNVAQTDANRIRQLAVRGVVTSPGGTPLRSDRNILNCPVIGFLDTAPERDQAPKPANQP
ncbi:MAG: hypothetical protein H0T39_06645 [Actinobacteria bacterium]|nr:hypothetical protein [Actinomycetota bacterium]